MSVEVFESIVKRIENLSGIVIQEHKLNMVQARIQERMNNFGIKRFEDYIDYLDGPNGEAEEEFFCNALTTNLTSFFREDHHFLHFESEVKSLAKIGADRVRVWSAGCSSGQEPYSISILLNEQKIPEKIPDTKILATDIDTEVLAKAKTAEYSESVLGQMPEKYRKYSKVIGTRETLDQSVKKLVAFRHLNLLHEWPMSGPFDFVFCRNVVIYFSTETKSDLISRFSEILKPKGILYLGHSETILGEHPTLKNVGKTIYQKVC